MKEKWENMKTIDVGTKVRTTALFLALINQILVAFGITPIPFNEEAVVEVLSVSLLGLTALWAWWKDNDITKFAQKHQKPEKE